MKLLLLHGPAINSSRIKLTFIRKNFSLENVVTFDSSSKAEEVLSQIATLPLIDESRLIIWENAPKDIKIPILENPNLTLVLWFEMEVDIKAYPGFEVYFFPEEKEASVFPFLDNLGSRDKKAYLELEKRNKTSPNDTQYILTMVFYLLRSLVVTPKTASDFVKKKNEKMRANFSEKQLINLYKGVLEIDFKIKQGLLETKQGEFSLVNLFTH